MATRRDLHYTNREGQGLVRRFNDTSSHRLPIEELPIREVRDSQAPAHNPLMSVVGIWSYVVYVVNLFTGRKQ